MNVDDRMGSCRDKGRMRGRVGAWCLSWWQRDPVGTAWSTQVAPQPGQAPGPLIHSTPPLVPTGPWAASTSLDRIPRFGHQNSLGAGSPCPPPIMYFQKLKWSIEEALAAHRPISYSALFFETALSAWGAHRRAIGRYIGGAPIHCAPTGYDRSWSLKFIIHSR